MLPLSAVAAMLLASSSASAGRGASLIALVPEVGGAVAVEGAIGTQRGVFLFDSGFGVSAVTPEMAKRIGCRPWGQITGFRAIGERLDNQQCQPVHVDLAGHDLALPTVMLLDLNRLMPQGGPVYAGAIGLDAFADQAITIQSRARRIVVEDAASLAARTAKATPIPVRLAREASGASLTAFVGIPTASGRLWLLLDTGNGGGTMIGRHAAALLGLDPARAHGQTLAMAVADGIAFKGPVQVLDLIMDGDLGSDFLDRWDLTLDLAHTKGWLAPAEGEPIR